MNYQSQSHYFTLTRLSLTFNTLPVARLLWILRPLDTHTENALFFRGLKRINSRWDFFCLLIIKMTYIWIHKRGESLTDLSGKCGTFPLWILLGIFCPLFIPERFFFFQLTCWSQSINLGLTDFPLFFFFWTITRPSKVLLRSSNGSVSITRPSKVW